MNVYKIIIIYQTRQAKQTVWCFLSTPTTAGSGVLTRPVNETTAVVRPHFGDHPFWACLCASPLKSVITNLQLYIARVIFVWTGHLVALFGLLDWIASVLLFHPNDRKEVERELDAGTCCLILANEMHHHSGILFIFVNWHSTLSTSGCVV